MYKYVLRKITSKHGHQQQSRNFIMEHERLILCRQRLVWQGLDNKLTFIIPVSAIVYKSFI